MYWANLAGERTAIVSEAGESITYLELERLIGKASAYLCELELDPGEIIALALPNSVDYVILLFAIFQLGGTAVPINAETTTQETNAILDSVDANFLVSSRKTSLALKGWNNVLSPTASTVLWRRVNKKSRKNPYNSKELLIQFTSGSTGQPKIILRTEPQIFEDYRHFAQHLKLSDNERLLAVAPFCHAYGAIGMYAILSQGAVLMPLSRFLPAELLARARSFLPTLLITTPPMIEILGKCFVKSKDFSMFEKVRLNICSTGFLGRDAYENFLRRFGVRTSVQYGSTETLSATVALDDYKEGKVGRPYPGVQIAIFDDDNNYLPAGRLGHVGVRSTAVCDRYEYSDELKVTDGYVLPGDRGIIEENGDLYLLGRDDIYNIGGYKVARYEIEALIRSVLNVNFVAVFPYVRAGQPSLRAIVEADDPTVTAEKVITACRERLSAYKVPSKVDVCDKIPRDMNGKVSVASL
jgi:long-chain acyl-CoA synthetase